MQILFGAHAAVQLSMIVIVIERSGGHGSERRVVDRSETNPNTRNMRRIGAESARSS
jgi:hypothetical protein